MKQQISIDIKKINQEVIDKDDYQQLHYGRNALRGQNNPSNGRFMTRWGQVVWTSTPKKVNEEHKDV